MPYYEIIYEAQNEYELPVKSALYRLLVKPMDNDIQKLISHRIDCNVVAVQWIAGHNSGSDYHFFRPQQAFKKIDFKSVAKVFVDEISPFDLLLPDPLDEEKLLESLPFKIDHQIFIQQTPLTYLHPKLITDLPSRNSNEHLFYYLIRIREMLFDLMTFDTDITDAHTPASEVWIHKSGVCQDFAHVMIGICRLLGIPARYVSGYLCQGQNFRGDVQLHAWVECLLPLTGWIGIDPSNNLLTDHHYIKISHGRDFYDCSPITGILISGGKQVSLHRVSVDMHEENQ